MWYFSTCPSRGVHVPAGLRKKCLLLLAGTLVVTSNIPTWATGEFAPSRPVTFSTLSFLEGDNHTKLHPNDVSTVQVSQPHFAPVVPDSAVLQVPSTVLRNIAFTATILLTPLVNGTTYPETLVYRILAESGKILTNGTLSTVDPKGFHTIQLSVPIDNIVLDNYGTTRMILSVNGSDGQIVIRDEAAATTFVIPGILSLFPPAITMVLALAFGQVILALLIGVYVGAILTSSGNILIGLLRTFDTYMVKAFVEGDHAPVLLFTFLLGGLIALVQKGGGAQGLADEARKLMTNSHRGQLCVWVLSLIIFFDDFSCILIVGSSLRSVLEACGVSKVKFGLIIHCMGVSLASIAPVSSWIGVQIGYVTSQISLLGLKWDPYMTVIATLQYRFFPVLMVLFLLMVILTQRDFAAMRPFEAVARQDLMWRDEEEELDRSGRFEEAEAERREHHHEASKLDPKPDTPLRWYNAVVPFVFVIIATFVGMILDGLSKIHAMPDSERPAITLATMLSNCDSVAALVRSSAAGWLIALGMLLAQRILNIREAMEAWMEGMKEVLEPQFILILAWALGSVISEVNTASYLTSIIGSGISPSLLPGLTMIVSSLAAFATGSGFGAMGIMFPLISPLVWSISHHDENILLQSFAAILAGSAFGNQCSPIADTSILTSLAVQIHLQDHLNTLMPYVLTVEVVSVVFGSLFVGMGLYSAFFGWIICLAILGLVLRFIARPLDPLLYGQTLAGNSPGYFVSERDSNESAPLLGSAQSFGKGRGNTEDNSI